MTPQQPYEIPETPPVWPSWIRMTVFAAVIWALAWWLGQRF